MVALGEQNRILTERGESQRFISPPFSSPAPDVRQDYSAIETCPDNIYDSTEIGIVQSVDRFPMQTGDGSSESGETYSDSASYLATVTSNLLPVTFGYDPNGPLQQETVTAVQVHTVYSLRDVTIENANGTTETIDTTDSHPFYVQGQGWVSADDLVAGEILSTPDGQTETVVATTSVAETQGVLVYNFTVADDHTYFVEGFGNNGTTGSAAGASLDAAWVHNNCNPLRENLIDQVPSRMPSNRFNNNSSTALFPSERYFMKVYDVSADVTYFQCFYVDDKSILKDIVTSPTQLHCIPRLTGWKPPEVHVSEPLLAAGDFYNGCSRVILS